MRKLLVKSKPALFFILVFVVLGFVVADYLANLPRERTDRRLSYTGRITLGAQQALSLALISVKADRRDFRKTALPVREILISEQDKRALNSNLPFSGRELKDVIIKIDGRPLSAKAGYNGISINHFSFPQKSWQIRLKDAKYNGASGFNLVKPRSETQLENWLGYRIGSKAGLLSPEAEFVHFRINDAFDGIRLTAELFNNEFLEARGLPPGKIFTGNITTEQIYGRNRRHRLFAEIEGWEVNSPFPEDQGMGEIKELIDIVQTAQTPYPTYYRLNELVDMEAMIRYMAMLEFVSSVHITNTHNWRMYFNPDTQKLAPIVFNTTAYFWNNNVRIDAASNDLFRVILSNPAYRERKDQILWEFTERTFSEEKLIALIESEMKRIRPDMHATLYKWHINDKGVRFMSNEEWEEAVSGLLQIIRERNAYLRNEVNKISGSYRLTRASEQQNDYLLGIHVDSRAGLNVQSISLKLKEPSSGVRVSMRRRGLEDIKKPVREKYAEEIAYSQNGVVEFSVDDTLHSKRRVERRSVDVVPSNYVYEFSVQSGHELAAVEEIKASSAITNTHFSLSEDLDLQISANHATNSVWWDPEKFAVQ